MTSDPVPDHQLLAELAWVRRVARRLLADEATADDVAQQTWLAAQAAPAGTQVSRRWLATVVHNQVRRFARAGRRRAAREAVSGERWREHVAENDPADIVERAELHRELLAAVMELDEPYRAAVLLRFLDELPATEVARRSGISHDAARKRISRGMQLLRERLQRHHAGGFAAWSAAWSLHLQSGAAAATTGTAWLLPVLWLMNSKGLLAGAVVLASAVWWWFGEALGAPQVAPVDAHGVVASATAGAVDPGSGGGAVDTRSAVHAAAACVVTVRDEQGLPFAAALVMALTDGERRAVAHTEHDGRATLAIDASDLELLVAVRGREPVRSRVADGARDHAVVMPAGHTVAGRVFGPAGTDVALRLEHDQQAAVWRGLGKSARADLAALGLWPEASEVAVASTGAFVFSGLPSGWSGALATTGCHALRERHGRAGSDDGVSLLLLQPRSDLELELQRSIVLRGRVRCEGRPVEGLEVRLLHERDRPHTVSPRAVSDADGAFQLPMRRGADAATTRGVLLATTAQGVVARLAVRVDPSAEQHDVGEIEVDAGVSVTVVAADGRPFQGASVVAAGDPAASLVVSATTDAEGRARLVRVPHGCGEVLVQAPLHRRATAAIGVARDVRARLHEANEVTLRVLTATGQPAQDVVVRVRADRAPFAGAGGEQEFDAVFGLEEPGLLSLFDLVPGVLLHLQVQDDLGGELGAVDVVTPPPGGREIATVRTALAPRYWTGVVRDEAGRPVPRARLHLEVAGRALHARTGADGTFSVGPLHGAVGAAHIEVTHPSFVPWLRDDFMVDLDAAEVEVMLERGRPLRIQVLQANGAPVDCQPWASFEGGGGAVGAAIGPGQYAFDRVPLRAGTVAVRLGGREFSSVLGAADTLAVLRVPDVANVTFGFSPAMEHEAGARVCVAVEPLDGPGVIERQYFPVTDGKNAATCVLPLPAGRYRVQLERRRLGRRGVAVVGEPVVLEVLAAHSRTVLLP